MRILEFTRLLLMSGLCGTMAQSLAGYSQGGCVVAIALGFTGDLLGTLLARVLGLPEVFAVSVGGQAFPIVWSIIGVAVFVGVLSLLAPHRRLA